MSDALERYLADVGRFPEDRQRDAANCIMGTLRFDAETFAKLDSWREKDEQEPPLEMGNDHF